MTIILASQSASRRAMLDAAGVAHAAHPAYVDESAVKAALLAEGQPPRNIADALAELKATKVSARFPGALTIGSDSVVAVGNRLYDKPTSPEEAARHLADFSGQTMHLHSAVVIAEDGRPTWRHVDAARLQVRALTSGFIDAYLDAEWPAVASCVGVFRIEGRGVQLFTTITGSHFTILGMPLLPLLDHLRARGAVPT